MSCHLSISDKLRTLNITTYLCYNALMPRQIKYYPNVITVMKPEKKEAFLKKIYPQKQSTVINKFIDLLLEGKFDKIFFK